MSFSASLVQQLLASLLRMPCLLVIIGLRTAILQHPALYMTSQFRL